MSHRFQGYNFVDFPTSDKVIEFKKTRVQLPYKVVPMASKAELMAMMHRENEAYEAKAIPAREARFAAAVAWVSGQDAPKDIKSCECGSEAIGSQSHSSWCAMFTDGLNARKKTSFIPIIRLGVKPETLEFEALQESYRK